MHKVGVDEGAETVLFVITVIVAVEVKGVLTTGEPAATFVKVYVVLVLKGNGVVQTKEPELFNVTL